MANPRLQWSAAWDSHPGNVRSLNEDSVWVDSQQGLWVVADGMGGHEAGEVASQWITQALAKLRLEDSLTECVDAVEDALLNVNDDLRYYGRTQCAGNTVGSTVVTLLARGSVGVALWAGDSRLYRLRDNVLVQITRDHNPVVDLLDTGNISEEEALRADTNIITRAVGGQLDLHLDVAIFDIQAADVFLLCTDGLYREVEERRLINSLQNDPTEAVQDVMRECLSGAARDNVTMAIAKVQAVNA